MSKYIAIFDSIVIILFHSHMIVLEPITTGMYPFYKRHNELQIHLHSEYVLLQWFAFVFSLLKAEKTSLILFNGISDLTHNADFFVITIYFF